MNVLSIEKLLAPLSEDQACGPDLAYDAAFMALETAALGTPERRQSDPSVIAPAPSVVEEEGQALIPIVDAEAFGGLGNLQYL